MSSKKQKICPLRVLTYGAEGLSYRDDSDIQSPVWDKLICIKKKCAWWVEDGDFKNCAVYLITLNISSIAGPTSD